MWLGPSAAVAQRLQWLAPTGTVSPDGFAVALTRIEADGRVGALRKPVFGAVGGELRPGAPAPRLLQFVLAPSPGVREVRVWAEDAGLKAELRLPVGPPAARVALTLTPPAPVKGRDEGAELEIRLLRPDGTTDPDSAPPVLVANVGALEPPAREAPGVYRARYRLPATRYPEVAVLVALSAWPHPQSVHGAFGSLRVPLATAIELPGRTEPGAKMTLEIASVEYGPTQAEADGRFHVPVVVPPGHRFGKGTAVDRHGNRRTSTIDLMLPPTDQLACVANPTRLPADGLSRARVLCASSDRFGKSAPNAKVVLKASRGSVSGPRVVGDGVLEWIYTAPRGAVGPDVLAASWREAGPLSKEELKIDCVQGPAAKLSAHAAEPLVHAGRSVELTALVEDALDQPRPGTAVEARATSGALERLEARGAPAEAKASLRYTAPADADFGSARVSLRAFGPAGTDPGRISAWVEEGTIHAAVSDLAGWPVPKQQLFAGDRRVETSADGTASIGPAVPGTLELRHAQWSGLRLTLHVLPDGSVFPQLPPARGAFAALELRHAPALPVNVRAELAGRELTYWAEDAAGKALPGRALSVKARGATVSPPRPGSDGRQAVTVGGSGRASVSIADAESGVTALVEVPP